MYVPLFVNRLLALARSARVRPDATREELVRELQSLDAEQVSLLAEFLPQFESALDDEQRRRDV